MSAAPPDDEATREAAPLDAAGPSVGDATDDAPPPPDEPVVPPPPTTADRAALQAAVADGPATPPRRRPSTAPEPDIAPVRRRWPLYLAGLGTAGAAIAALVVLGQVHAGRYALRCGAKQITAERGRSFPPWGFHRLGGPAWRPIAIPPGAECQARETDDRDELEGWYLTHLTEQATSKLEGAAPGDVDAAEAELEQALLLARTPERRDLRRELERLRGDVTYWRAAAKLKAAGAQLEDAARAFDAAAAQRPRHASDPGRWAGFARTLAAELAGGPDGDGATPTPPPTSPRPMAPAGVALPVDGPAPSVDDADAGVPVDGPRRDLPTGGVLM